MTEGQGDWPNAVLVVDDEPSILTLFELALPDAGFAMQTAPDAETALEMVDREPFACILADKNLPGMDGIELARLVAQRQPHCACVIMTGYPSLDSVVEALRNGMADYLLKPFDNLDLVVEKIHHAIRHQRAVYGARVLGQRVQSIRKDLSQRDARLAQMAEEIEHLSEVISVKSGTDGEASALSPEQQGEVLEVTINLARSLLTYTANLISILDASPLTRDDSQYIEKFAAAASRLDTHLDTVDFVRKKI